MNPPHPSTNDGRALHERDRVRVSGRYEMGVGEVLRVCEDNGLYVADVVFESSSGRRLETLPAGRLERVTDPWQRLANRDFDDPRDFLLRQLAWQFSLGNTGGELTNSRTQLLPHQILLTHEVVKRRRRRMLIADEVGLGKTIETGMIIRELISRGEARRVLIITPAGLVKNWQSELRDCFRLEFEVLGIDFQDYAPSSWENHHRVIASIDTLKRPIRMERVLAAPRFDLIVVDEAHHVSRIRYGKKSQSTQNYKLLETLRGHTRDLLFLSATPHQGNSYQFWSLLTLLDDQLFESPEAMVNHRGLLNHVMTRRTKREVTDAKGGPLFVRRQVTTERFEPALREQRFYEQLTTYLRTGYEAAGTFTKGRTTSTQRAIGFVMTTFQKMMSSSPRAIKQALRRRLLVLLIREKIRLEQERKKTFAPGIPEKIVSLQDEMRLLSKEILSLPDAVTTETEADGYIAKISQRIVKKLAEAEEVTEWSLDGDEDGDEGIFSDAEIPDETEMVRELLRIAPDGTDRKFDRLLHILSRLQANNPGERFIVFTQYRETLEFLRIELAKIFGWEKVVTIKGGSLEAKIDAVERFWDENGAKILISTSAGGEGINLQIARVLFNYDLPWNPMAVEQRIGRIHRYGQKEVSQVYTLVAEGTVEERIYTLLWDKLSEIARSIGKTDPETGEPMEDFRTEILGYIGSNRDYQQLFREALVNRDYRRTAREIERMVEQAQQAQFALDELTQDLTHFNLEHYRRISGQFHLEQLGIWCREAVIRLGGSVVPNDELWHVVTPECLATHRNVAPRYENATFDRALATRRKKAELLGIGHPLVDALISYLKAPPFSAEVTCLAGSSAEYGQLDIRYRVTWDRADFGAMSQIVTVRLNGDARPLEVSTDPAKLPATRVSYNGPIPEDAQIRGNEAIRIWVNSRRTELPSDTIPRIEAIGISIYGGG